MSTKADIFYFEQDPMIRDITNELFQAHGYTTLVYDHPSDAIGDIEKEKIEYGVAVINRIVDGTTLGDRVAFISDVVYPEVQIICHTESLALKNLPEAYAHSVAGPNTGDLLRIIGECLGQEQSQFYETRSVSE